MISMALSRELTKASFPTIARKHGRTNHTTAMSAVWREPDLLESYPEYIAKRAAILRRLNIA
jgi:chromosomal replication initiation ATPase DnaA